MEIIDGVLGLALAEERRGGGTHEDADDWGSRARHRLFGG